MFTMATFIPGTHCFLLRMMTAVITTITASEMSRRMRRRITATSNPVDEPPWLARKLLEVEGTTAHKVEYHPLKFVL